MIEKNNVESRFFWRDEHLKLLCGFANSQGGKLLIGVYKGIPKRFLDVPSFSNRINNVVKDLLGISVTITVHWEGLKKCVGVTVAPYQNPISYKGQFYYRQGIINKELKGEALDKFLLRKQGKPWDGVPVPKVKLANLSDQTFALFRKRAVASNRLPKEILSENNKLLLESLRLKEGTYLKRAALLLFHPDPEAFFTGAYIKVGFFRTHADLLYHDTIHGNLFEQVDKTMDLLLTKYRIDTYPFPEEAIKEAVINAVLCKDYGCGIPIQISVYNDRFYIWNQGKLPDGGTKEKLLEKHPSLPYNPGIANAFFQAGYLESWEGGMKKIVDECTNAGLPAPVFDFDANGLLLEFKGKTTGYLQ